MYRLTASLLNSWQRATDPDAEESAYVDFLADLGRENRPSGPHAHVGIQFENDVMTLASGRTIYTENKRSGEIIAISQFADRVRGGAYQVRGEKRTVLNGLSINLVGIADFMKAGIITDIKRPLRYEYGKYQFSAQHPMYMEIFPECIRFDYLIYDGSYCYMEQYRRGDFEPIGTIATRFLNYLDDAGLMDIYQQKWREK